MSRWIGHDHIHSVLAAADAWREQCLLADGSLFGDQILWTLENIQHLKERFLGNPIEGTDRNFFEKLSEQLDGAPNEVICLAAEMVWLLVLFPIFSATRPDTKRQQIREVWEWSGTELPESPFLSDDALKGVGHPGTAYMTRRDHQFGFILEIMDQWKALPRAERNGLMATDVPWAFMAWLDGIEDADRRPVRNAILYFLFPDHLERNMNNEHRGQIVDAFKHRLPEEQRPRGRNPSLEELDQAIFELRRGFEEELGTREFDFYRPPIHAEWFTGLREKARTKISAELKRLLSTYNLELRQCGSKKKTLASCKPVSETTGFWENPNDATNKPLRWILHLELQDNRVIARVPNQHGARRLAFANTAQGTSGAVTTRIIPAIKLTDNRFAFYENWEWLLLHCFLPALPAGSSGQLFEEFDEITGMLTYKGQGQEYVAANLITLQEDDNEFAAAELPRSIRYSEATEAIATLIHVAPVQPAKTAQGAGEVQDDAA